MKLIDEKGKIFGFINIIDCIVLLVVAAVVFGIGYRGLTKRSTLGGPSAEPQPIIFTVRATEQMEAVALGFQEGDTLFAKQNYVSAKITAIEYEPSIVYIETAEGEIKGATHPTLKDILFTIEANVTVKGPILEIGGQEIRIGSHHWVKTQTNQAAGLIESIEFITR
ncbi:MAG: DUF4330 domain-containing protein [Epulopiscium sp.]|nr:DUF4330 domain-containing protein [Candidatus Epulonipiscium sp.]